ncbi:MAG TPA: signal peptidase I [Oligoflexia bacterium]|nr:signal peptidase I [Oligoflexia bacterium]HMR24962.1 signal peptidase I [Oligoflexia bacterium]
MKNTRKIFEFSAIGLFVAGFIFIVYFKLNYVSYRIPSGAMSPTVIKGDWVWGRKLNQDHIKRYDIVAYERDGTMFISRVVALPGDSVELNQDNRLLVNDKLVGSEPLEFSSQDFDLPKIESYGQQLSIERVQINTWHGFNIIYTPDDGFMRYGKPLEQDTVPEGEVYLVSDYRSNAMDSRIYGSIPKSAIKYKITRVYFSQPNDFSEIGKRLKRVGKKLY